MSTAASRPPQVDRRVPAGLRESPVLSYPDTQRTFVILRLLGVLAGVVASAKAVAGRMPAAQETIRYTGAGFPVGSSL